MYDRLYVGKKDDADKAPVIEGRKEENGCYSFAFPADETKYGQVITVVPGVKEETAGIRMDVYVQMPVKNETLPDVGSGAFEDENQQKPSESESSMEETTEFEQSENSNGIMLAAETAESETRIHQGNLQFF